MKINKLFIMYGMAALSFLYACRFIHHDDNLAISVRNSDDSYSFKADYDSKLTTEVERYVAEQIKPISIFNANDNHTDLTVILADRTTFNIKSYPGELQIKLDKTSNSEGSYNRISSMCNGIREILKKNPVRNVAAGITGMQQANIKRVQLH